MIGFGDKNSDADEIDYPIPANDDAIRAVRLLSSKIADAVIEGRRELEAQQKDAEPQEVEEETAGEPVAAPPAAETEATSLPVPVENKLDESLETAADPELVEKAGK